MNDIKLILVACVLLGFAPFYPEPHLWGKVRWILGGAEGMQMMDWFDFAMHGSPYVLLIRWLIINKVMKPNTKVL